MNTNKLLYSRIYGEDTKRLPLIVLHGLFGMSDNWGTFGRIFGEKMPVHTLDLRNHGHSFHSDEMSLDAMVQDLDNYLNQHGITTANILGHSLGGKVAMQFALEYPWKAAKLVVADIAPKAYPPHHHDILAALSAVDMNKMTNRADVQQELQKYIHEIGVLQFLLKNVYRSGNSTLDWRFNLDVLKNKYEDFITPDITQSGIYDGPTLFLAGERSNYILPADRPRIHTLFPNAQIQPISNSGHWVQAENPKEFNERVMAFLDSLA